MGRRWILPSSSVVPRFAMMVIERSLSISTELRAPGFVVAVAGLVLQKLEKNSSCNGPYRLKL
jgi:hypothetical protein